MKVRVLAELQRGLERIYRLEPAPEITGFLLEGTTSHREELLILEEEELFVGVSLDPAALVRLGDRLLADMNLDAFCIAVEGVSHFIYVIHRARQSQPTTILELELQAEVDKFVAALLLVERCPKLPPARLRTRLYDEFSLLAHLLPAEQQRYVRANQLARRYARQLEQRFVRRLALPAMIGELRRFYRMSYRAKQELIQRAA